MNKSEKCKQGLPAGTVLKSDKHTYRVVAVLGAGGFGITYRVERTSDGVMFAMKEYFPDTLCERAADNSMSFFSSNSLAVKKGIDNFITEARRLIDRKISHPNVVSIGEVFRANNTAYYTMEYIDGCNLWQYMKRTGNKPLTAAQVLSVARPILQVLDLIHSHSLTHLDIKHENILLTWEDDGSMRPVLIDFGLAKHYDKKGNATSQLTNAGCSVGFAPPEQYLGLTKFTPQADIYALCATMLYLLTAIQPDKEMSATEITRRFEKSDPGHARIPERIRRAIIDGMRKDKDDRTQSATELAAALGLEISSHSHEGSVTRLLDIGGKRKSMPAVDWKKVGRPLLTGLGAAAVAGGIIWGVTAIVNRPERPSSPSEELSLAIEQGDPDALKRFAELDSARAFLPYARVMLDSARYSTALSYASMRLGTPDHAEAEQLMALIKSRQEEAETETIVLTEDTSATTLPPPETVADNQPLTDNRSEVQTDQGRAAPTQPLETVNGPSNDELFARASSLADYKTLADKGYAKAYAPLAEKYFYAKKYWDADRWVRRALAAGIGTSQARSVADKLETIGFYDNGENGGKPK